MRTILNPSNPNHEWFEELCALAAIGELGAAEFRDLQEHLAGCPHCRHVYADFCRISADDIGLVAIQGRAEQNSEDGADPLDVVRLQDALARLAHGSEVDHLRQMRFQPVGEAMDCIERFVARPFEIASFGVGQILDQGAHALPEEWIN